MKFLLLVKHDDLGRLGLGAHEGSEMLAESIQLTHALHANAQYLHASPLMPTADGARVAVRNGKFILEQHAPGYSAEDIQAVTGARLEISPDFRRVSV